MLRPIRRLSWSVLFLGVSVIPAVRAAQPLLNDSATGMTCHFHTKSARLQWKKDGGDWVDATGEAFGGKAYAAEAIPRLKTAQYIQWDITELAQGWLSSKTLPGAVFLRAVDGDIVNFFSREHSDAAARPSLVLEWDDGKRVRVDPTADTHLACPNHGSSGDKPVIKVGGGHHAVLLFPFEPRVGRRIVRSHLIMVTDKQYGRGASLGIFGLARTGASEVASAPGLAGKHPNDAGLESNPDVIFVERFDRSTWLQAWAGRILDGSTSRVTADAPNGFESLDGEALKVTIQKGVNQGLNIHYRLLSSRDGEPDEAYFRYYLRFGQSWDPSVDGGKLPGFSGTYGRAGWGMRQSDGKNGWSARGKFFRQDQSDLRGIGTYVYHASMNSPSGDTWGWGMLEKNRWYSVEQHVKLNTPGKADGVLRAWIDGKQVFDRSGIRFRDVPELKIESIWMNVYHGGVAKAPKDLTLFIDNVVVARRYIGPMTGGPAR